MISLLDYKEPKVEELDSTTVESEPNRYNIHSTWNPVIVGSDLLGFCRTADHTYFPFHQDITYKYKSPTNWYAILQNRTCFSKWELISEIKKSHLHVVFYEYSDAVHIPQLDSNVRKNETLD